MTEIVYQQEEGDPIIVNLREPHLAALLAWIWPGAGHFYQRRFAKGFLFMICVLSIYFFGLALGHGRVVYASFRKNDIRWHFFAQIGAGAVTFPAIVQNIKTTDGADPYWVLCERFPENYHVVDKRFQEITPEINPENYGSDPKDRTLKDGFMAPPPGPIDPDEVDTLGRWHFDYKHYFDLGTVYTMVAGLLNLLAIYDAFCGPTIVTPIQREKMEAKKKKIKAE
ncbi:MAG: DUF6677 family protein [Planctomycetota bacterium]